MKTKISRPEKIHLVTLGCSKNLVDSENLLTQLHANAYDVSHNTDHKQSDIVIINTCGFIDRAKEESIDTIIAYSNLKEKGKIKKLYVTGCLSERYKPDLEASFPEVDGMFGTMEMPSLLARLNADYKHELIGERIISTPAHYAYLKISEGCNRTCSFCAIPLMRGDHRSVEIEQLVAQTKHLVSHGVKEIMLIAQELTYYGLDLYKKRSIDTLLYRLNEIEGLEWIRLHYAFPSKFPSELIQAIKSCDKVCKYLDMPLQHISDRILKDMKRQITKAETISLLQHVRAEVPNIALRTTFMVGYPGETEAEFEELASFIEEQQFDRIGVFQYSHEENTPAFGTEDNVPTQVKEERTHRLMEIQQDISFALNQKKIGQQIRVMIDRKDKDYFYGRTFADSPDVDNEVLIDAKSSYCRLGDFATVEIIQAEAFDLRAKVI